MKNMVKAEYACVQFTPNIKILEHSEEKVIMKLLICYQLYGQVLKVCNNIPRYGL